MAVHDYLDQARQLQTLSLTVHLPLVCFGIAFPSMVMFAESRYLRNGDRLYRTIAQRWSKVMLTLFAVGVVTGTILSFEFGVLWPNFIGMFGNVFGLGFALEGFSFFLEAIFIGIYVYGWDRLSPRMHFLSGIPVVIAGVTGSTFVIAVNAWMNHPTGFRLDHGKAVDVHPWAALFGNSFLWQELVHMYLAAYIVVGFLVAGWYAWCFLRGRFGRYERAALAIPLAAAALVAPVEVVVGDWAAREVAKAQPVKLAAMEGLAHTTRGAPEHLLGIYEHGPGQVRDRHPAPAVAARRSQLERDDQRAQHRPGPGPSASERGQVFVSDDGADRHAARAAGGAICRLASVAPASAALALVLPRDHRRRPAVARRSDRRLDHD
jgi:cytochrome d ubiquinol oxidase subunit I